MLRRDPSIERLGRCHLFAGCDRRQLARIRSLMCPISVTEGTVLLAEGQRGTEFFVVLAGHAMVLRGGTPVASAGPGDFFGEIALLDRGSRAATVVAAEPMELLVASAAWEFYAIAGEHPVSFRIASALARRLRMSAPVAA
jgi:CRP/FNR family cyclic AMP-dependent transcriptional regulator